MGSVVRRLGQALNTTRGLAFDALFGEDGLPPAHLNSGRVKFHGPGTLPRSFFQFKSYVLPVQTLQHGHLGECLSLTSSTSVLSVQTTLKYDTSVVQKH